MKKLLEVKKLHVKFEKVHAVRGVSFTLYENEILGIVGESGSGKSMTVQAILDLVSAERSGEILYGDEDLLKADEKALQKVRGSEIGIVFQDPFSSLNPTMRIGKQVKESLLAHQRMSRKEAREKVYDLLAKVGIPEPKLRYKQYPHELSGGMRQRVMIASALAASPKILIADEPTTALDVTIQAQILRLLQRIRNTSMIFITHDLGILSEICDRMLVMYAGKVVESGLVEEVLENPQHPYTQLLIKSHPGYAKKGNSLSHIPGAPPDLTEEILGCGFYPRCPFASKICKEKEPPLLQIGPRQKTACHYVCKNQETQKDLSPAKETADCC